MNRRALALLVSAALVAAQEKKPAEETKPVEEAQPAQEAAAESPTPVREKRFTSTIDLGYRFLTDIQGDLNTYRSLVNLGEGPKLLGWDLAIEDPSRKVFDRLTASAHNWGGDPYNTLRVDAERRGSYRFTADYRNIKYFNSLPSFANPRVEQNVFFSQRAYDMGRRLADVSLELFPGSRLIPYVEYSHDSGSGSGVTPFVTNGNEFPVATDLRDRTNHYRGGVRLERDRYHVTLEQGGATFKDDQRVWTRDRNTGNRGPISGTSTYLNDLEQAYGVRGTSIYSKVLSSARPADWLTLTGQFLFSQPEIDTNYTENARGLFFLGATQFYPGQDLMTVSMAKQPHTSGAVGAEVRIGSRVRVLESWTTDRFHNAASAVLTGQLLLAGNATTPVNQAFTAPLVVNYSRQQVDVLVDVTRRVTLRGGHRYVWGDALARAPGLSQTGQPAPGELRQHVGLAGGQFRATANTTVSVDYEGASTSEAYFRTSLRDYQQVRVRARHQLPASMQLGVNFRFLDNQSPEEVGGYKFRDMDTSVSLLWTPQNGKRMSLAGEYSRTAIRSDLTFLVPQSLQPARSFYRDNGHTASAMLDLVLPQLKGRAARFTVGGTLFISSGSRPTDYYQPVIGFRAPLAARVEIFTDWRWYGYSQTFYLYEGFRSHQVLAGLRWTM